MEMQRVRADRAYRCRLKQQSSMGSERGLREQTGRSPLDGLLFHSFELYVSTISMDDAEKAKFIDDNRGSLIQGVTEVMPIVEELGAMVHPEAYAVIYAEKMSQNKMRELYQKVLPPGGMRVKAALYDAIAKHHPHLIQH
ncbi:uncharacterized protein V6R79_007414 [Siganus canaliculatus]